MNKALLYKTILEQIISEKATLLSSNNQYSFKVRPDSNKKQIKLAVEEVFSVNVLQVRVLNRKGKVKNSVRKRGGKSAGKTANCKKAIVKLQEGQFIDVSV